MCIFRNAVAIAKFGMPSPQFVITQGRRRRERTAERRPLAVIPPMRPNFATRADIIEEIET
jgi:hypothetical protein